ncbi:Nucleotide-binding, alpha-beta plait [Artemisia annua]|uniref:Nucleotide-binding, alpha-beta plait n=1 Tax=Artemisia annua TaxID=35608 RepID=A0A2U1LXN2_ARTAN|nr:Nucleotide-binding, alpha-beta plait [Artemisia annua]
MGRQGVPSSGSSSSSGFGDTSLTKVFVGGLAWETQSETMREYFEQFGDILEAVVITDKITGRSKGYGFVTFQDPESARKACVDPAPIIDRRRANCNLASLGSPRHVLPFGGSVGSPTPFAGGMPSVRGPYFPSYGYQQPLPFSYQQGLAYPPYTYATYGPEYVYPQGIYNQYAGQQYLQIYGVPGTVNAQIYPYNQMGQTAPNYQGFTPLQSYALPGQQIVQFNGPIQNGITTSIPTIQAPYSAGVAAAIPGQHFIFPAPPQFIQGGGSGQISGSSLASYSFCCLEVIHPWSPENSLSESLLMAEESSRCLFLASYTNYQLGFASNSVMDDFRCSSEAGNIIWLHGMHWNQHMILVEFTMLVV